MPALARIKKDQKSLCTDFIQANIVLQRLKGNASLHLKPEG